MEIRELQVKDVFTIAKALAKITRGARLQLATALSGKKTNPTELGMVLFGSLFSEASDDLLSWLADLISKEKADFEVMPATAVLDIIEKLAEQEGIRDFFGKASLLATKLTGKG